MNKEKIIMYIWTCVTIIFGMFYVCQLLFDTIREYKLSNGTTIAFDGAGLAEIIVIASAYYLTKLIIKGE